VWLLAIIATPLLGAAASIVVALITRRDTKADIAEVKTHQAATKDIADRTLEQVQNTHPQNLRDDLDEKFASIEAKVDSLAGDVAGVRDDLGGMHSETRDLRKDVTGIRTDARRDRRKLADQEQALDEHLADVPRILDEAFAKHAADCPARHLPKRQ
jgi:chromosome segregation ATPase